MIRPTEFFGSFKTECREFFATSVACSFDSSKMEFLSWLLHSTSCEINFLNKVDELKFFITAEKLIPDWEQDQRHWSERTQYHPRSYRRHSPYSGQFRIPTHANMIHYNMTKVSTDPFNKQNRKSTIPWLRYPHPTGQSSNSTSLINLQEFSKTTVAREAECRWNHKELVRIQKSPPEKDQICRIVGYDWV